MASTLRWDFLEYQQTGRALYAQNRAVRQFLKPILNLQGAERILDVGCGIGTFGKLIQPYLTPNAQLIGIDIDPVQVAYGNRHWARQPNMRLEVGDATRLPYPASSFEVVAAMGFLEFIDATAVLPELRRVLKCPGKLVVIQIDPVHYEQRPLDSLFEQYWEAYLTGMQRLGVDLELAAFQAYCKGAGWMVEEFTFNIEYRVQITANLIAMVRRARGAQSKSERYLQELFEFNYQFVKHAGWSEERLWEFLTHQYSLEAYLRSLQTHLGEEFYQNTPLHVYRVLF